MSPTRYEELLGLVTLLIPKSNQRGESVGPNQRFSLRESIQVHLLTLKGL